MLAALGALGLVAALVLWPRHDAEEIEHVHDQLPPGHAQIHEDCAIGRERPKHAGLALATATKNRCLDATRFCQALFGADDPEGHYARPLWIGRTAESFSARTAYAWME